MEPDLSETVRATAARHAIFSPGGTIVVAVSGGPDSTALLHALAALREEWGLTLVGAHLNHGFRGDEADADAAYVSALCDRLELAYVGETIDVPALSRRRHLSAQVAAREARHAFLRRAAAEAGADRIALGHTRDDRIETLLLNLLRGAGPEGLAALPPVRLPLVRPLLDVSRTETHAYCDRHALHPRHDSSNAKTTYLRNRMRAELLPILTTYYNEKAGDAILRTAELVSADNVLLESLAAAALDDLQAGMAPGGAPEHRFAAGAFAALPLSLRRRVIRMAVSGLRGDLQNIEFATVEQIIETVRQGSSGSWDLPDADARPIRIVVDAATIAIVPAPPAALPLPWRRELAIPGTTELPIAGISIEATVCANRRAAREEGEKHGVFPLMFRLRELDLPIIARSWRPGDRFRPQGLGGTKKLQDLFADRKVPREERARIPILVEGGGEGRILAAFGIQSAENAVRPESLDETDPEGGEILLLTAEPA